MKTQDSAKADTSPSYEEVTRKRRASMLRTILDFTIGTLWWVRETLWQELRPNYDRHSTREGHPALSIRRQPVEDLYSQVPMLHGRSEKSALRIRGVTPEDPDHDTYFGHLLAPVPVIEAFGSGAPARIRPNTQKPRLTRSEQQALEVFLVKRNLAS